MDLREAAEMALEALEYAEQNHGGDDCYFDAIEALRTALAQPEQEPINYEEWNYDPMTGKPLWGKQRERIMCGCGDQIMPDDGAECGTCVTARNAVKREWQGLTDEEIEKLVYDIRSQTTGVVATAYVARAIEAKLREKNFDRPS